MDSKKTSRSAKPAAKGTKKAAPKKAAPKKGRTEMSDAELEGVSGGYVKFQAGKALKDAVR